MKGFGSFLGDKWMQQSVSKNQVRLINAVADSEHQAWLAHQSCQKHKETVAFPTKKHNLHPSFIMANFTPYSVLTI